MSKKEKIEEENQKSEYCCSEDCSSCDDCHTNEDTIVGSCECDSCECDDCHTNEDTIVGSCECNSCECDTVTENDDIIRLENEVLLAKAELQNYRKRKDEETYNFLRFANQDLILELLPIVDNFERAIQLDDNNLSDELSKFLVGFKMMYSHLTETLRKYGVEEIPALGQEFDSSCMEAIMTDKDLEKANNLVLDVFVRGYRLKDRIIRPASVKVNQLED